MDMVSETCNPSRNLGACSGYKVDAFLDKMATLQYWWAAPSQFDAWTCMDKTNRYMALEKDTLALPLIIQPPPIREGIYWKLRRPGSPVRMAIFVLKCPALKEYRWACGRSAGRLWIWIWDTINVTSLKNLKNRSDRGWFYRRTTRCQRWYCFKTTQSRQRNIDTQFLNRPLRRRMLSRKLRVHWECNYIHII